MATPKRDLGTPRQIRRKVLQSNRQACAVCGQMPAVVHYINGNRDDHRYDNLVALCPSHGCQATPNASGLVQLSPNKLRWHKKDWERQCLRLTLRGACCPCAREAAD